MKRIKVTRCRKRLIAAAALMAAVTGLSGCNDEPSESDMRTAVENHTRKALASARPGSFSGFMDFRKQGCVDSRKAEGAYDCYYAATLAPERGAKPMTVNGKARFRVTDTGLTFEDLGAQPR